MEPSQTTLSQLYVVKLGDTLASVGERFNVSAGVVANANGFKETDILPVGARLHIPPTTGIVVTTASDGLEEIIVSAPKALAWYQDWRIWVGGGLAVGLVWYLMSQKRKRHE